MGLFDTVFVSSDVAAELRLACAKCGTVVSAGTEWQTKSLNPCMYSYSLRHDASGDVRLFLLDRPSDKRFWRPWTDDEIRESEQNAARGGLFKHWVKRRGGGTFLPEAYLPENRRQRFMGELPHQWVELHTLCSCDEYLVRWLKFCDGVVRGIRETAPEHPAGFFDDACGFGD